jgi:hypothetical protein
MPKARHAHKRPREGLRACAGRPVISFAKQAFVRYIGSYARCRTTSSARLCPVRLTVHDIGALEDWQWQGTY